MLFTCARAIGNIPVHLSYSKAIVSKLSISYPQQVCLV